MAITNPQAITFSNTEIRPLADLLKKVYWMCKRVDREWTGNDMGSLITNTEDIIEDGNVKPITGVQATNIINRALELIADYEANSYAKLNTILQVAQGGTTGV